MCLVELGGGPLLTRARFLWGASTSVEEIDSSMVSLQACLTSLTLFRRVRRLFFGTPFRARAREERTISSPQLPVQHMSRAMLRKRSFICSNNAVGERELDDRPESSRLLKAC